MKAESMKLSKVFGSGGDIHYVLPHFQREYAWEKENWQTLLDDVMGLYEVYSPEKEPEHFMGALVVIQDGTRNGVIPAFKLVDGQQRLTTLSLMLSAFGKNIEKSHPAIYKRIQRFLINTDETDLLYFKLIPTTKYGDRAAYFALMKGEPLPNGIESKIPQAYQFFDKAFNNFIKTPTSKIDPERLFKVLLNSLQVVFIDLNQGERPYEIFESLNAKGKPLSQADLVRNYIAMKLPEKRQEKVFNNYWSNVESLLQEKRNVGKSNIGELTAFLRHYLAMRNSILCNQAHVYERFRDRIEKETPSTEAFEAEISALKEYAIFYDRLLRPEQETNLAIRTKLQRLNTLEVSTAYPFLLAVYAQYDQKRLSNDEFIEVLEILENYVVRRYLSNDPANYLNKMFPGLWREVSQTREISQRGVAETLKKVIVAKNYPADNRLRKHIQSEELYEKKSSNKIILILDTINRFLSCNSGGYTILDNQATVEHILPQTLNQDWKAYLGPTWEEIYTDNVHTLGNLTLVTQEWNSALSNAPFNHKKELLSVHALKLNEVYFTRKIAKWDDMAIQERANFLADVILQYWPELGAPPVSQKATGNKPISLIILGEPFEVNSWRDVAYYTAKVISILSDDFERKVAKKLPSYFSRQEFPGSCRQLPNGWWLYLHLSANSIKNLCWNMLELAEISEEDWQLEEA